MSKPAKKKRPLTDNQQIALARRNERRAIEEEFASLRACLLANIPEGWRSDVLRSLYCVLSDGHVFTLACGKASVRMGRFGKQKDQFWRFVDEQNGAFARVYADDPDRVNRWNSPRYPELVEAAATAKKSA